MGRPPRVHYPGVFYHVFSRGNASADIFLDRQDYLRFLDLLCDSKARTPFELFAYALMPNHFHLLVRVGRFSISRVMHRLLTRYVSYFNWRHHRKGHLFEHRFKSPVCADNAYLLGLVRYIHLNPVRAGLASGPGDWEWSGHREYTGTRTPDLIDTGPILSMFADDRTSAVRRYMAFMEEAPAELGSPGYGALEGFSEPPHAESGPGIEELALIASRITGVSIDEIRGTTRCRTAASARRRFIRMSSQAGFRHSDIARFVRRAQSTISRVVESTE